MKNPNKLIKMTVQICNLTFKRVKSFRSLIKVLRCSVKSDKVITTLFHIQVPEILLNSSAIGRIAVNNVSVVIGVSLVWFSCIP